jgi:hypothetical protein
LASLLMLLTFYSTDIFTRRFWDDDVMPILALMVFTFCYVISLILSLAVVMSYRRGEP